MTDMTKYGPWVVIAGGSEGVGAEFARQLAGGGLNLVLIARIRAAGRYGATLPGDRRARAHDCRGSR
ncbi:hypothetical protein NJB1907Z4_C35220 [Mycobacterium pseudoshottsii]|uniref:Uncharacterized protein n=1 Tax=Mycobacterium pseudoshottsii TaxID=265949 RepID=A0A9N7LQC6_9MYCO|nr:hypothetical protein NJB1907Z4_C35220 [Mycobacterium pseudoshottsii]